MAGRRSRKASSSSSSDSPMPKPQSSASNLSTGTRIRKPGIRSVSLVVAHTSKGRLRLKLSVVCESEMGPDDLVNSLLDQVSIRPSVMKSGVIVRNISAKGLPTSTKKSGSSTRRDSQSSSDSDPTNSMPDTLRYGNKRKPRG